MASTASSTIQPSLDFFNKIPFCAALLTNPSYTAEPVSSRTPKPSTEDVLFGHILATSTTIPHCLALVKSASPLSAVQEIRYLIALQPDLNGYPHVCHGGIVATLLDELMGVSSSTMARREAAIRRAKGEEVGDKGMSLTAELVVRYIKPVPTPSVVQVVVSAADMKVQGRKRWVRSEMVDAKGVVLAEGRALFVTPRSMPGKI
jgi:acyl-coenzyme A thioesterase THEM4